MRATGTRYCPPSPPGDGPPDPRAALTALEVADPRLPHVSCSSPALACCLLSSSFSHRCPAGALDFTPSLCHRALLRAATGSSGQMSLYLYHTISCSWPQGIKRLFVLSLNNSTNEKQHAFYSTFDFSSLSPALADSVSPCRFTRRTGSCRLISQMGKMEKEIYPTPHLHWWQSQGEARTSCSTNLPPPGSLLPFHPITHLAQEQPCHRRHMPLTPPPCACQGDSTTPLTAAFSADVPP